MTARLGNVLYWLGCIVAACILLMAAAIYFSEGYARQDGLIVTGVFALAAIPVWLIGRACRYVLAGN